MSWALGLAATQPVGLREMFGTMTKSFHPGRAAQNGLTAAMLASRSFTSSEQPLEAKSGWTNVLSTSRDYTELTRNLGRHYEISLNTYKPFACGVVIHPAIDGCIQLRNQYHLAAGQIDRVDLRVHPLVLELTGKKTPQTGLEGKFSVYYAAAVAIVKGAAGEREFSDALVRDPAIVSAARPGDGHGRSFSRRGAGEDRDHAEGRSPLGKIHRESHRKSGESHVRRRPRC